MLMMKLLRKTFACADLHLPSSCETSAMNSKRGSDISEKEEGEWENVSQFSDEEECSESPPVMIPPRNPRGDANPISRLFFW